MGLLKPFYPPVVKIQPQRPIRMEQTETLWREMLPSEPKGRGGTVLLG